MVIGFLGKGGSGKSTVATQVFAFLRAQEEFVLAVDADHNLDFAYNLSGNLPEDFPYFGTALPHLREYVCLSPDMSIGELFTKEYLLSRIGLDPLHDFLSLYSREIVGGGRLMAAGPQTEAVLYGQSCSHSLTSLLKLLLPLIELAPRQVVLVDEKAGADGVSTGIVTGLDVAIVVCEPAIHSLKTAKQIIDLLSFYHTPAVVVANKIQSTDDITYIHNSLGVLPAAMFPLVRSVSQNPLQLVSEWEGALAALIDAVQKANRNDRVERTIHKYLRNKEFTDRAS